MAERLNCANPKKRRQKVSSQCRISCRSYAVRLASGNPGGHTPAPWSCQACQARKPIFDGRKPWRRMWNRVKSCSAYGPILDSVDCSSSPGTSSGLISVSRMAASVSLVSSSNWPLLMTHRIRCWMSVFGTPELTL